MSVCFSVLSSAIKARALIQRRQEINRREGLGQVGVGAGDKQALMSDSWADAVGSITRVPVRLGFDLIACRECQDPSTLAPPACNTRPRADRPKVPRNRGLTALPLAPPRRG